MQFKKYLLIKLLRRLTRIKKYLSKCLVQLAKITESLLKTFAEFKKYWLTKLFKRLAIIKKYWLVRLLRRSTRIKKYWVKYLTSLLELKTNIIKRIIQFRNHLLRKLFNRLIKIKKRLIILLMRLIEIKNILLRIFLSLLNIRKYLSKGVLLALELGFIIIIYHAGKEFHFQNKIAENIKIMQRELIETNLVLTNLLSKSAGNINIVENSNHINIKQALSYSQQQKSHKLELILLNPNYSLIDCTGDMVFNISYPVKINLIWQPMPHFADQYELICERYTNFNNNAKQASNKYRKVLLRHINSVKFKFLEYTDSNMIKDIETKQLQQSNKNTNDFRIKAVQIGMVVQSQNNLYSNTRHNWYSMFNDHINFLDNLVHKVIYITINSNLT